MGPLHNILATYRNKLRLLSDRERLPELQFDRVRNLEQSSLRWP